MLSPVAELNATKTAVMGLLSTKLHLAEKFQNTIGPFVYAVYKRVGSAVAAYSIFIISLDVAMVSAFLAIPLPSSCSVHMTPILKFSLHW